MPTLQFKGKTFVQNHHLAVKYHQLVPRKDLSVLVPPSGGGGGISLHDNLIIEGDNLKAIKELFPSYAGKIDYTRLKNRIDFCQLPYEIYKIQK